MRIGYALASGLACATLLAGVAARAQSFVGIGPVRSFTLPTEPRGEPVPAPASASTVPQPAAEKPVQDALRRMPATQRGFSFSGERADAQWPVYLTAAQARQPARFQLAFLSAISVVPEGSRLTLAINDRTVAQTELAPPDATAMRAFDVPAGLLVAGFNAIRITVEQRHRVDCSTAATYELWTALDAARSGLLFAEPGRAAHGMPADIAAIAPRGDGALPLRLLITGKLTPESARRAIKAAQIAALAAHVQRPIVAFTSTARAEPGLEIAIGTAGELAARPDLADLGPVEGPRYGFLPNRPGRAATFVVTGTSPAELEDALRRWDEERAAAVPAGSAAGLKALATAAGLSVAGGETIRFGEAGLGDVDFSGRLLRTRLDLGLPSDFLPADYDRLTLVLAGSTHGALTSEASLLVEVNGRSAATQSLGQGAASPLERNRIFLPLSLMRPGQNRIEVLAQLPARSDEACAAPAAGDVRLQLLDRSEVQLPRLARIGRAPELASMAAGAEPFGRSNDKPVLFVPTPDRAGMAAAATLAARLAISAGRPLDFAFTMTPPPAGAAPVLLVGPATALDAAWLRAAGLDPDRIKAAWQGTQAERRAPLSEAEALARRCTLPPARVVSRVEAGKPAQNEGLSLLGLRRSLPALPVWQTPEAPGAGGEADIVTSRAALLVGQDVSAGRSDRLWTVVTAPDAAGLQAGVECLVHPAIWSGLSGRISALGFDETLRFVPAGDHQRLVATQDFSLPNARLVAAGWLSLNPLAYVALVLLLVLGLAGSTLVLVLNSGRRQE